MISSPVRSPTCARRGYRWPPKLRWLISTSRVRSKTGPHSSTSWTRSGSSRACSSAMPHALTNLPPRPVSRSATGVAREAVQLPADQMAERMTAEGIAGEQSRIDQQDVAADTDAEPAIADERAEGVGVQNDDERDGEVQRIAVQVLDDQETGLSPVSPAPDADDGARRRRREERAIVSLAIVVAGRPEREREDQDQEGGRRGQEPGPPRGPGAEPGVLQRRRSGRRRI